MLEDILAMQVEEGKEAAKQKAKLEAEQEAKHADLQMMLADAKKSLATQKTDNMAAMSKRDADLKQRDDLIAALTKEVSKLKAEASPPPKKKECQKWCRDKKHEEISWDKKCKFVSKDKTIKTCAACNECKCHLQ